MNLIFLRSLFVAILAWTIAAAHAQTYRWGNVAIGGGGFVSAIVPSKTQQNLFYARTDVGGAYRWDNATSTWLPLLDTTSEADAGLFSVESLALDPNSSAVVYLLVGVPYFSNGKTVVMRSTDYGATFTQQTDVSSLFRANGNGLGRANGEKMQVDPGNSNVVYVGSRTNGLFKSSDAGASFSRVSSLNVTTTPNESGISFVLLDPGSVTGGVAQRIFVGVSRYGSVGVNLYRSDDAGASFSAVASAPNFIPQRAALSTDGNLYITYGNGSGPHGDWKNLTPAEPMDSGEVWKYNVASGAWTNVTPAGITKPFSGISVDPNNPQRLIASTINTWMLQQGSAYGDHFFISTNGGSTWTDVVARGFALDSNGVSWIGDQSIHWAGTIEFDPFNTGAVWVTSGNGVFRTSNIDATTATWTFAVKGLEETVPQVAVSVPGGPLLSTILDYDGFSHTDINAYAPIHTTRMGSNNGLAVASANPTVAVRVGSKMYYSTNTGSSWTEAPSPKGTGGHVSLSSNGAVLLHSVTVSNSGTSTTTTYRSTNFTSGSPTWTTVSGLSTNSVRPVADPVNASKFYVYDNGTVRVSTDGGASFTAAASVAAGGSTLLRAAPGREGDVWVALKSGGLTRSTNSGISFTALSNVTYCGAVGFGKVATGASYPTVFIWGSVNGGTRGIYRSTDAGANWVRVNDDAHQYGGPGNGELVMGDMNTEGVVYMSSVGRGIVYGAPTSTRLQARHSGKCLDVPGSSTTSGAALIQYSCASANNQLWAFEDAGSGYSRLKVAHSGMCMDLAKQSSANAIAIVQATCGTKTTQHWTKEDMGGGYFRLRSRYSGKCVDVNGAGTTNNVAIIQYACGAGINQQWINY